ncbi:hypothetical protein [Guyparkeria sp.]|uniref:hypothetical protein n=1 Tax=Guyparkeria sp. TaxID=2035736 RepID=UPI0039709849
MTATSKLPLIVLGGSDRKPAGLPQGAELHPVQGYKAASLRVAGRPLMELVLERSRASGEFRPIYLAGPRRVFEPLSADVHLIDTDGSFGDNIQRALTEVVDRHPGSAVAFMTSDILPDPGGLRRVMAAYHRQTPCDLWFPLVRVGDDDALGASGWKPRYGIVPRRGQAAVEVLPGHLLVVDPQAMRLGLAYRLFQLAYTTRNRKVRYRRNVILSALVPGMLWHDLLHLLTLRPPLMTWSVLRGGLEVAAGLRRGDLTLEALERALRFAGIKTSHRRRHPERRVILPITDELSLALDIDTEEEAAAMAAELSPS